MQDLSTKNKQTQVPFPFTHVAGVSSPVNNVTFNENNKTKSTEKRDEKHNKISSFHSPFFYCAGVSSPSAGNPVLSGINANVFSQRFGK